MKCDEMTLLLDELLDGGLDEASQAEAQAHIEGCRVCAEAYRSLVYLRDEVQGLPRSIEPPRDLWPEIEVQVAAAKVARGRFGRRPLMAAAAAVLLITSVVTRRSRPWP